MIAVSLLGRVVVTVDGVPISGEAAQRRRLALVALLCVPSPRPVSRDRLLLYLWPDSDAESGHHLLSVAVHVLRKALGREVVVTTADEVALLPESLQVDVAAFEEAVRRGEHAAAVELYGGPFMDGFHAGAGPELEQWVDAERARLQRTYAQALEGVAAERRAAGDAAGAVEAWRKLAALDPYSSHGALGLMRAMADAGNRAGAIRHAAVHRQLLAELEAVPDPDVEALAEALKAEPPAPAPAASPATSSPRAAAPPSTIPTTAAPPTPELRQAPSPPPIPEVAAAEPLPRPGRFLRLPHWRWAAAALVVVALAGFLANRMLTQRRAVDPAAGPQSIAVLPFSSIGSEPGSEYLGEGIAEQILEALSSVEGLRVVARTSSFAFRRGHGDVRAIGDSLGVQWVLDGSVERSRGRLRVSVELASARDGMRAWAQRYEKPVVDIFEIEDDIARSVASALAARFRDTAALGGGTSDPEAAELYMQGRREWFRRTPGSLLAAARYFEQAVARDSAYAFAYAGLADALVVGGSYDYGVLPPDSAYPRARTAAKRALELNPRLAAAHAALASVYMDYEGRFDLAEQEFRRAIELEPGYSPARQWYGLLLVSQRRDAEALQQMQSAGVNDPLSPALYVTRAQYFYYTRQYPRAIQELQLALRLDPAFGTGHLLMALTEVQVGRAREAAARMEAFAAGAPEPVVMAVLGYARAVAGDRAGAMASRDWLVRESRRRYVPAELPALVSAGLGDRDAAFRFLQEARRLHSNGLLYLAVEPAMDPLRTDPRFAALVAAVRDGRRSGLR